MTHPASPAASTKRRTILGLLVAAGSLVIAGIVGIPALVAGISPAMRPRRQAVWRRVGPLTDFPVGEVTAGEVEGDPRVWPRSFLRRSLFVWRPTATETVVFSRSCTDLGCALNYGPGSGCFFCPCHGGIFDQAGNRLAGPPNRPLDRFAHRIHDGVLEVDISSIPPAA